MDADLHLPATPRPLHNVRVMPARTGHTGEGKGLGKAVEESEMVLVPAFAATPLIRPPAVRVRCRYRPSPDSEAPAWEEYGCSPRVQAGREGLRGKGRLGSCSKDTYLVRRARLSLVLVGPSGHVARLADGSLFGWYAGCTYPASHTEDLPAEVCIVLTRCCLRLWWETWKDCCRVVSGLPARSC